MTTVRVESLPLRVDDETASVRALRLLAAPDATTVDRINALRTYSMERCVELNSDGLTWDCPVDPADIDVPESAVAAQEASVLSILDEFDIAPCGD